MKGREKNRGRGREGGQLVRKKKQVEGENTIEKGKLRKGRTK